MVKRIIQWVLGGVLGVSLAGASVKAEEEDTSTEVQSEAPARTLKSPPKVSKARKGRPPREKETEGTEAPDRFQADTVIKSEYEVDGKKLEVDPD